MDWFERITGFPETDYETTRTRLVMVGHELVSLVTGTRHGAGRLELCSLAALRERVGPLPSTGLRTEVRCIVGDARAMHLRPENHGALFQVASQFNLLEMIGPEVSPEDGVSRYAFDRTQGPACAMAAGAGTIFRNYFVPVGGASGQTATRQIDTLAPLGAELAARLGRPVDSLWTMQNGYALCTEDGLLAISELLNSSAPAIIDRLRGLLVIGLHHDVEVTDAAGPVRPTVSQAYCSALPVAYGSVDAAAWEPLARLVLEAAYEATLRAAVELRQRTGCATMLLTRLGGGAFGNDDRWIDDAIDHALSRVEWAGLDVQLVSYGSVHRSNAAIAARWG
jgi:hypothetical protein